MDDKESVDQPKVSRRDVLATGLGVAANNYYDKSVQKPALALAQR